MALENYDAKSVILTFGPVLISGYGPDSFVSVERNEDSFSLLMGADGEACRAKSNNRSGRVTCTLLQSALSNDLLMAIALLDERSPSGDGIAPLFCKSGRGIYTAEKAWIVKPPSASYAREVETREWVFETDELIMFVGGA